MRWLLGLIVCFGALLAMYVILPPRPAAAPRATDKIARSQVGGGGPIASGLQAFRRDIGRFPTTDEGLAALFEFTGSGDEEDSWDGPYMGRTFEQLVDPWGSAYEYRSPGKVNVDSYDLWSRGPDKKDDEGKADSDDVKNWIDE